jgi:charged multivesicular body protein 3
MGWLDVVLQRETPEQLIRKWTLNVRRQERELDRQLGALNAEEQKVKTLVRQAAKRGDRAACVTLAKELVYSTRAKTRLHMNKAQLGSLALQLQQQLAHAKMVGGLQKSSDLMRMMNRLVSLPDMQRNLDSMSREMIRAGVIDELVAEGMAAVDDPIADEADQEASRIVAEITSGLLGEAVSVDRALPTVAAPVAAAKTPTTPDRDQLGRIRDRLNTLKNT